MLKLLSGIATAAFLIFAPSLAKSQDLAATCVTQSADKTKLTAILLTKAKQAWDVKPEGVAKINAYFGTTADSATLLYFSGNNFGYALWRCGAPLPGHFRDVSYLQMKAMMEAIKLEATDTVMIGGRSA
jgi:hypothetical protein